MLNLIKPRHLTELKKHLKKPTMSKASDENSTSGSTSCKKTLHYFKKLHCNATRTKVTQFLSYKAERLKNLHHPSFWLLSRTYIKRLGLCFPIREP